MQLREISVTRRVEPFTTPADQVRFAAEWGLVQLPPHERFPLHSGRGVQPEWWRQVQCGVDVDSSDPRGIRARRWVAPEAADTPFVLGDRIGPLPTAPLSVDKYSEASTKMTSGSFNRSPWAENMALIRSIRIGFDQAFDTLERRITGQGSVGQYTNYVEPRGFSSIFWALRARAFQAWGALHPGRFAFEKAAMLYEPSSLAAAQAARRAGRLAWRDQILERHIRTVPAFKDYTELLPGGVETQFVRGRWGWREMRRALESGWTLVDADHPRALDSFAAATAFIRLRTVFMNAELRALEEAGIPSGQAPLHLSAQAVLSFNRDGRNEPLWFAPEHYADAALSYAVGLQRQGQSVDQVTRFLDVSRSALEIAAAANALATRIVSAHLNAAQAWRLVSVRNAFRDVDRDHMMSWEPSARRIAAKQEILTGISTEARTGS